MLDTFIIEEIKRRERESDSRHERPRIHKELPQQPPPRRSPERESDGEGERGVVIIDYSIQGYGF